MHPIDFDRAFARQRNDDLRREVATHRLARCLRDSRRGSRPQVPGIGRGHGRALSLVMALLSLLVALAHQTWAAQPARAQEQAYTLSVSVPAGGGRVTGPGIDCGASETDCSQGYDGEFRRVCEPDPDTGRPVCFQDWSPSAPTLAANTPPDWRFAGWGGACAGTGVTCAVVMDADKSVSAAWTDVAAPSVSLDAPAGDYVSGTTTLKATAADNDQISRVEFFTWERKVGEDASAPYEVSLDTRSLPDGLLMLRAVAHDRSGRSAENRRWPVVDNTDPLLEITGGPDGSTAGPGAILAWTFRTSDATSGLSVPPQCAVLPANTQPQGGDYEACSGDGQHIVFDLPDGNHRFWVKATDGAGNITELSRPFGVDATAPETTIVSGPAGFTRDTSAAFVFSSTEQNMSTFECSLDSSAFTPCASPESYSGLKAGEHSFRVRVSDAKWNVDASPATRIWTVDKTEPSISGTSPGNRAKIRDATPTIRALVKDPQTTLLKGDLKLYVDGKPKRFSYSASTDRLMHRSRKLEPGRHTAKILAKDAAGNAATKSWRFTVVRR